MRRSIGIFSVAASILVALSASRPVAATDAETEISVTIENAGGFSIAFAELQGGYTLVNSTGGTTFTISATTGNHATAMVRLAWTDDRIDAERAPYTVNLSALDLTSSVLRPDGAGVFSIPAANLSVISIGGDPLAHPARLDEPRAVYTSAAEPVAGETTLDLTLRLDIPASIYPTTYRTTIKVHVAHGENSP
ncbi:MAG: hypothetical protein QOF33_3574 [Thermomicrobiales bacterium]|nr:hypothetical protein [Thermomicrobiales bacterium]